MITQQKFYGDSFSSTAATITLHPASKRVVVARGTGNQTIILPDARKLQKGGPLFFIMRPYIATTGIAATVKDKANNTLFTLPISTTAYQLFTGIHADDSANFTNQMLFSDNNIGTYATGITAEDLSIFIALSCNPVLADKIKFYVGAE